VGEEPPLEPQPQIDYKPQPEQPAIESGYSIADDERRTMPEEMPVNPDAVTAKTRAAIMLGFKELGVTERSKRLELVSDVVKREVHSVNQLTEAEGRRVVGALHDQGWPEVATP